MSEINPSPPRIPFRRSSDALHSELGRAVMAFHEAVARRLGMTMAERRCLAVLAELGAATPGELARATGLTTGAITGVVDRLEKSGHVTREANPKDRRSLLVRPARLEQHMREAGQAFEGLSRAMVELQSRYGPKELELIHRYLGETTEVLKSEAAKLARAPAPADQA